MAQKGLLRTMVWAWERCRLDKQPYLYLKPSWAGRGWACIKPGRAVQKGGCRDGELAVTLRGVRKE